MKNVWRSPVYILVMILLTVSLFSQENKWNAGEPFVTNKNNSTESTTDTSSYADEKSQVIDDIEVKYPRAAKKFALKFPRATNLRWTKEENALFAWFSSKGHKAYAAFTLQGKMNYAVTYLEASELPKNIARKIANDYGAYTVFNVKQVLISGYAVYQIILESEQEFIHVQTAGTDIEEIDRLIKIAGRE
jgi:uncharacterized protein YxeA